MKVVIFAGGYGTRHQRGDRDAAEAAGRDRRDADALAHHEDLLGARAERLRGLLRLQGPPDQEVLPRLLPPLARPDHRPLDQHGARSTASASEPWRVTLADTGLETMTGGRLQRVRDYLGDETFCLTYGDGVTDIDITAPDRLPPRAGPLATVTAVQQPGRFGALDFSADGKRVDGFREKSADGRPPDQRRLLRLRAGGDRLRRRRRHRLGAGAAEGAGQRRPARRLPPQGLLAEHGHAARQARAPGDVGQRQGAVEGLGPAARAASPPAAAGPEVAGCAYS